MCGLCNAATIKRPYGGALSKLPAVFYEKVVARVRAQKNLSYFSYRQCHALSMHKQSICVLHGAAGLGATHP